MGERGGCVRFRFEALQPLGIDRERGRENLDRDVSAQAGITRAIDFAHPAGTEDADDFVRTKSGAGGQRHR